MSTEHNIEVVKNFFAAMGSGDENGLLALVTEDIEWIVPGDGWPLAGAHRGHTGVREAHRTASRELETTFPTPPAFIAQGDRVIVVGVATGKVKATGKSFKDDWVFDMTVRDGKVARLQEYIDTQALARASRTDTQS